MSPVAFKFAVAFAICIYKLYYKRTFHTFVYIPSQFICVYANVLLRYIFLDESVPLCWKSSGIVLSLPRTRHILIGRFECTVHDNGDKVIFFRQFVCKIPLSLRYCSLLAMVLNVHIEYNVCNLELNTVVLETFCISVIRVDVVMYCKLVIDTGHSISMMLFLNR